VVVLFIGAAVAFRNSRATVASASGRPANLPRPWTKAWKARLRNPHLSPAEFTQLFADAARSRLRGAKVSVLHPLAIKTKLADGTDATTHLDNAWNECRNDPSARVEVCRRWIGMIAETRSGPAARTRKIVAMIWGRQSLDALPKRATMKAEPLVADLWIMYAEDRPNSVAYLPGDFPASFPELRRQALQYLQVAAPEVQIHGDGASYFMLTAGGNFEASFLLVNSLWDEQAKRVEGDLVAAVPARDVLLFTGSRSSAGMTALRAAVHQAYSTGTHPVSESLLVWRHGAWQEYRASAP
jgi:hypothetical protein